jgi:hypothetical protein
LRLPPGTRVFRLETQLKVVIHWLTSPFWSEVLQ